MRLVLHDIITLDLEPRAKMWCLSTERDALASVLGGVESIDDAQHADLSSV
ncbi:MAG: hypothetical protein MJZ09_02665 [Bacteroidales bacterium]|nr:hypothetical protein [Bacteroidales bacterium]